MECDAPLSRLEAPKLHGTAAGGGRALPLVHRRQRGRDPGLHACHRSILPPLRSLFAQRVHARPDGSRDTERQHRFSAGCFECPLAHLRTGGTNHLLRKNCVLVEKRCPASVLAPALPCLLRACCRLAGMPTSRLSIADLNHHTTPARRKQFSTSVLLRGRATGPPARPARGQASDPDRPAADSSAAQQPQCWTTSGVSSWGLRWPPPRLIWGV